MCAHGACTALCTTVAHIMHASRSARRAQHARGAHLEDLPSARHSSSPHAARLPRRLSARSSHRMSGYHRVREVEGRQNAACGAPSRRHSRPGRLQSNVFMDEDMANSWEEIEVSA